MTFYRIFAILFICSICSINSASSATSSPPSSLVTNYRQIAIQSDEVISGRVGDGQSFYLKTKDEPYQISLDVEDRGLAQMIVMDEDYHIQGILQSNGRRVHFDLCPDPDNVRAFRYNITGIVGTRYSINSDRKRELEFDKRQKVRVEDGASEYFSFYMPRDDVPMVVTVKSGSNKRAMLSAAHESCRQVDARYNNVVNQTYLLFSKKARLTISNVGLPAVAVGVWYIGVHSYRDDEEKDPKELTIKVDYGMSGEDMILPILLLLFIFPAIVIVPLLVVFLLMFFLQKLADPQGKPLPRSATYEEAIPYTIAAFFFFFMPAIQLAIREAGVAEDTGNRNQCFYNELCNRPAIIFQNFNSIFSNWCYVAIGLIFLTYVFICRHSFKGLVPRDCTILYAIGFAFIAEGFLSGIYHICPTRINFQFDVCFMFVIGALVMMEMYRRYFKRKFNVGKVFLGLAILIGLDAIGSIIDTTDEGNDDNVNNNRRIYRLILFFVIWLPLMLYVVRIVYFGESPSLLAAAKRMFPPSIPAHPGRIIYIICLAVGLALIIWLVDDFANIFLYSIILATLLTLACYVLHKLWIELRGKQKRAPIVLYPIWLLLLAGTLALWGVALWLFSLPNSNKSDRPEESRLDNRGCVLLNYYGTHELWHFFSAFALFASAVLILHIDQDEDYTPQEALAHKLGGDEKV
eukprot:TRINITY_DN1921_c0_g1_i1.p1 TRINITY_DN1921_c0_g1~~TRINITY_DN1921_c0_g1_i1.p1  ORF type:complete len:689 (+),score=116.92 TRINITY_DN1921_c0_g1_i1:67-2133(+)